jgi:hypothetical protein
MELNPAGVKDRQVFRAKSFLHAISAAIAGWLAGRPICVSTPSHRQAAIPALAENYEAKRILPGNR